MMGTSYCDAGVQTEDSFYRNCLGWYLSFALWPRRCHITNCLIWLKFGYRGVSMLTGPGDPIIEHRWHDRHEHIIWKIKGN